MGATTNINHRHTSEARFSVTESSEVVRREDLDFERGGIVIALHLLHVTQSLGFWARKGLYCATTATRDARSLILSTIRDLRFWARRNLYCVTPATRDTRTLILSTIRDLRFWVRRNLHCVTPATSDTRLWIFERAWIFIALQLLHVTWYFGFWARRDLYCATAVTRDMRPWFSRSIAALSRLLEQGRSTGPGFPRESDMPSRLSTRKKYWPWVPTGVRHA
jgi:hypothetical protein